MPRRRVWPATLTALAVLAVGCLGGPDASRTPTGSPPPPETDQNAGDGQDGDAPDTDEAGLDARAASLRLRVTGPSLLGPVTGSGFAIGPRTVITNAHVVDGGTEVDLVSWDGDATTSTDIEVAVRNDLGRLTTSDEVPAEPLELADRPARRGDEVTVVGFPHGGQITVEEGVEVVDLVDGASFDEQGEILVLDTRTVRQGSSGGPVLDERGRVVGVVFAVEIATQHALAVPVASLQELLDE